MSKFSKQHKNSLSIIKKLLLKEMKLRYRPTDNIGRLMCKAEVIHGISGKCIYLYFNYNADKIELSEWEDDKYYYICWNIENSLSIEKYDSYELVNTVIGRIFGAAVALTDDIEYIKNLLGYDVGTFRRSVNSDDLEKKKEFQEILNNVGYIQNNISLKARLRDDQFPKLKNREVLPLIIINKSNGIMDYCAKSFGESNYRRGRLASNISDIVKYNDIPYTVARYAPTKTLDVDVVGNYITVVR